MERDDPQRAFLEGKLKINWHPEMSGIPRKGEEFTAFDFLLGCLSRRTLAFIILWVHFVQSCLNAVMEVLFVIELEFRQVLKDQS